jgi:hypothetical protein
MAERRKPADDLLDWLRFRLDTFPRSLPKQFHRVDYQELPWIDLRVKESYRSAALQTRWQAMLPVIKAEGIRTAVDIGSNSGWFVFSFADLGIPAVGLEGDTRLARVALYTRKTVHRKMVGILVMELTPANVTLAPSADCSLVLSVWHHFVRDHGLEDATAMLATIWGNTRKVLFFETAEEMPASWRLPDMSPEPRVWLSDYLEQTCRDSRIVHLGVHETVSPENVRLERNLFAVVRTSGQL